MTDHQPDRLTVATLEAALAWFIKRQGLKGVFIPPREMREARLTELVVVCHAGGAVSVGLGEKR